MWFKATDSIPMCVVAVALVSTPTISLATLTVCQPTIGCGGGPATSATYSATSTLGQSVAGNAAGQTIALVAGSVGFTGCSGRTVSAPERPLPVHTALANVAPNPFHGSTSVRFEIAT